MSRKVLLIGDPMEDVTIFCKVRGVCQEFPGVILNEAERKTLPGGALNVKANLESLGLKVEFIPTSTMSVKTRVYAGDRLLCRYDKNGLQAGETPKVEKMVVGFDAVVISDYDKGWCGPRMFLKLFNSTLQVPVFVDTKAVAPEAYRGADFIFPSLSDDNLPTIEKYREYFKHTVLKVGSRGCYINGCHFPTTPLERADTVGAGDVFMSAFIAEYLRQEAQMKHLPECAKVANMAAYISCTKRGTSTVTWGEILLHPLFKH